MDPRLTECKGIHQSDIIIRSALMLGIQEVRRQPWLLDYALASLAQDPLTRDIYGENIIAQAKTWFMNTEVPVLMTPRVGDAKLPALSIALMESTENEATLGDVHHDPFEAYTPDWPVLAGPLDAVSYSPITGILQLPDTVTIVVVPGMYITDRTGKNYPIRSVSGKSIQLDTGVTADFSHAFLKTAKPSHIVSLESLAFRETYQVGCHVQGEPVYLSYLYSIIKFILLRGKEDLLEARGFGEMTMGAGQPARNEAFAPELVFTRYITLTGRIRDYWPKRVTEAVRDIQATAIVSQPVVTGETVVDDTTVTEAVELGPDSPLWDTDPLFGRKFT